MEFEDFKKYVEKNCNVKSNFFEKNDYLYVECG